MNSFYWHDFETFGVDPMRTRPSQFAGLRTDQDLQIIGEPLMIFCQPNDDFLPSPEACLITGITPQIAQAEGVPEYRFAAQIYAELAAPGTCGVGYNSLRFDDHVTRFLLYRNFYEPYGREWQNGNSRWDLIDVVRLCYALRPSDIEWPMRDDGSPSFKLSDLSTANNLEHAQAHDALSDVHATLELARLLRDRQPRLFDWSLKLRDTQVAKSLLDINSDEPVLHASARTASARGGVALMTPIAPHPTYKHAVICFDLNADPDPLMSLAADEIKDRLYTPTADLPPGVERVPLKVIHANRAPVLAPLAVARGVDVERIQLDVEGSQLKHDRIRASAGLIPKLQQVFATENRGEGEDPDFALYSGGFIDRSAIARFDELRDAAPERLNELVFGDERLDALLFRYRARNHPETLSSDEQARWQKHRRRRLIDGAVDGAQDLAAFNQSIAKARERFTSADHTRILDQLTVWGEQTVAGIN